VNICICLLSRTRVTPIWSCHRDRTFCQFSVNMCNINSCVYLKILCVNSDQPTKIQVVDHVSTFARSLDSHIFMEYFWEICSSEDCCPVLVPCFYQFVQYMFKVILRDLTCLIWVGFSNENYSWVRVDTCEDFICYHCHYGIKVMMMFSSNFAAILYEVLHVL
jgi:hypothetical protein